MTDKRVATGFYAVYVPAGREVVRLAVARVDQILTAAEADELAGLLTAAATLARTPERERP
jgi:hypothetical protein